jgi:hypothetical protein
VTVNGAPCEELSHHLDLISNDTGAQVSVGPERVDEV